MKMNLDKLNLQALIKAAGQATNEINIVIKEDSCQRRNIYQIRCTSFRFICAGSLPSRDGKTQTDQKDQDRDLVNAKIGLEMYQNIGEYRIV